MQRACWHITQPQHVADAELVPCATVQLQLYLTVFDLHERVVPVVCTVGLYAAGAEDQDIELELLRNRATEQPESGGMDGHGTNRPSLWLGDRMR